MKQHDQVMPETIVQKLHDKEVYNQDVIFDRLLAHAFKSIKEIQAFMDSDAFAAMAKEYGLLTKESVHQKLDLLKDDMNIGGASDSEFQILERVQDTLQV